MELTKYSRNRFLDTMVHWHMPKDYADPIYNYLVYGFNPGSFFTSVFANDFIMAVTRSHPANTIGALKTVSAWIVNSCPPEAWGSYDQVQAWQKMGAKRRRTCLEQRDLVYTEQQEIMMALENQPTVEPFFY